VLSRGCTPTELKTITLTWHGPVWLNADEFKCPTSHIGYLERINYIHSEEKITPTIVYSAKVCVSFEIDRYSSLNKLSRSIAYLLRYKNYSLSKRDKIPSITGALSVNEILTVIKQIIKLFEDIHFSTELKKN